MLDNETMIVEWMAMSAVMMRTRIANRSCILGKHIESNDYT